MRFIEALISMMLIFLSNMTSQRTKACGITPKVRKEVLRRDGECCIFCGTSYGIQIAHYIGRGAGGLGIEQNLVCACVQCHYEADNGADTKRYKNAMRMYLERKYYPNWNESELRYKK